jgi:hypothetical protein
MEFGVDGDCDAGGCGQDVSSLQQRSKERCTSTAARRRFCQSGESFSATLPHCGYGSEVCSATVTRGACRIFLHSMQVLSRSVAGDVDFHLARRAAQQSGQSLCTGVRIGLVGRNLPPLHETNNSTRDKKAEGPPENQEQDTSTRPPESTERRVEELHKALQFVGLRSALCNLCFTRKHI